MEENFMDYISHLTNEYLAKEKAFVLNPKRAREMTDAFKKAKKLFPHSKIEVHDDPLQTGSLFLVIRDIDITVRETKEFADMISNADNFEIYPCGNDEILLSICFNHVNNLINKGKE